MIDVQVIEKEVKFPVDAQTFDRLYVYVGNLMTERSNFKQGDTIISFDRSVYLGRVDYEIEIEYKGYVDVAEYMTRLQLTDLPQAAMGKYRRFASAYDELFRGGVVRS